MNTTAVVLFYAVMAEFVRRDHGLFSVSVQETLAWPMMLCRTLQEANQACVRLQQTHRTRRDGPPLRFYTHEIPLPVTYFDVKDKEKELTQEEFTHLERAAWEYGHRRRIVFSEDDE